MNHRQMIWRPSAPHRPAHVVRENLQGLELGERVGLVVPKKRSATGLTGSGHAVDDLACRHKGDTPTGASLELSSESESSEKGAWYRSLGRSLVPSEEGAWGPVLPFPCSIRLFPSRRSWARGAPSITRLHAFWSVTVSQRSGFFWSGFPLSLGVVRDRRRGPTVRPRVFPLGLDVLLPSHRTM